MLFASAHSRPSDRPQTPDEIGNFPLALLDGPASRLPVYQWLESISKSGLTPIRCSNLSALRTAVASGAALSILPCTKSYGDPDLVACFPPMTEFDVELFLIARRSALRRPPVRDLFEAIEAYLWAHPQMLSGERP